MSYYFNHYLARRMASAPTGDAGPSIGYNIIGSPTIAGEKMSLSQNDSGVTPTKIFHPGTSTWEIRTRFRRDSTGSWDAVITSLDSSFYLNRVLWAIYNGQIGFYAGSGSEWDVFVAGDRFSTQNGTWYNLRIRFTGTAYYADYGTDGNPLTSVLLATTSATLPDFYPFFGSTTQSGDPLDGEWDLNATAIYIDGQLWWKATPYISFADPAVEAICVANWSSDGIGLTMQDAAAVTSLGNVFSGNTSITAFTELIYFTGLTDVSVWEFNGCDNLTKIGFPPNAGMFNLRFVPIEEMVVSNLAGYLTRTYASMDSSPGIHLFSGEGGEITRIVIPQSISHISGAALAKHKWIEDISIHSMITNIGNSAFGSCNALLSLTVPGIASIPDALCDSCSSLSLLTIGEGAETIGNSVARYTNTIVVDLPSTITSIGNTAFAGDGDLTLLIKATNPPSIATNAFNIRRSVTIYVPYSADHSILDAYKAASGWSTYASQIYELNPDGTIPS